MQSKTWSNFILSLFILLAGIGPTPTAFAKPAILPLQNDEYILAVGDIHGDLNTLRTILIGMQVMSEYDNWIGGSAHLVMAGDLNDRGPDTRGVFDLLMRLQDQAEEKGGHVHAVLGNHEILITQGQLDDVSQEDLEGFKDFRDKENDESLEDGYLKAFQGNTIYAKWVRSRPALLRIGDTLFAHGGVSTKMLDYTIEQINEMVKAWVMYYQGVAPAPARNTQWVMSYAGPMWNRGLKTEDFGGKQPPEKYQISTNKLEEILKHFGANRLVVGHTVIPDLDYLLSHPEHGDRVLMIDSANSRFYEDGKGTAIEIDHEEATSYRIKRKSGVVYIIDSRKLINEKCKDLFKK